MMAIDFAGAVYCPLSPREPTERLYGLIKQTQSHLILVDHLTRKRFTEDFSIWNVDTLLLNSNRSQMKDSLELLRQSCSKEDSAYVIFTSGSTGTPKAVCEFSMFIKIK